MHFRNDINGLRVLAVIAVILFHSGIPLFSGGFLGVDVFFVISGFLITSNLIKDYKTENLSIKQFYIKRIRRIFPPLIFTIILCTICSFIFMLPYDLKNYGQSVVSSLLGFNNVLLYLTTGYWSVAAEMKPLYHTWSLGVEEQYYFIIPLIFIIGSKFFKSLKSVQLTLIFLMIISFILSYTETKSELNFLSIHTRFWEICIGSVLAFNIHKVKTSSNVLSIFGFILILASFFYPQWMSNNQAVYNLLPIGGTLLIILFSKEKGVIETICKNRFIQILGLSSYSAYLLHQPILAFLRLSSPGEINHCVNLFFALLSLPLSYLMWKYIENPFRSTKGISNKKFFISFSGVYALLMLFGLSLHLTYGMQKVIPSFDKFNYGGNPQQYADDVYRLSKKQFEKNAPRMLIIGNSFARDFYNMIHEVGLTEGYEVVYLVDYFKEIDLGRSLMSNADIIFQVSSAGMAGRFPDEAQLNTKGEKMKQEFKQYAKGLYYSVGTKNYGSGNNNFVKLLDWDSIVGYKLPINKSAILANEIQKKIFEPYYIDLIALTAEGDSTHIFTDDQKFISFDTGHLTKHGAKFLGELLIQQTEIKSQILDIKKQNKHISHISSQLD